MAANAPTPPSAFHTAHQDRIELLYHWQRFDFERLRSLLRDRTIYCSDPAEFNDPWDCKPHFNTTLLDDPAEHERHVQWSVDICQRHNHGMSAADIARMEAQLRADRGVLAEYVNEISEGMWLAIASRYRVYCLGTDPGNILMWSHYADNHRGICLEFRTRDVVMCSALRVEYHKDFPIMHLYSADELDNLRPLLAKADVWAYEREYRLIAQERSAATAHETLLTDDHLLSLPESALVSVIVGCQGPYDAVKSIVAEVAPNVLVKRAVRVPNHFEVRVG